MPSPFKLRSGKTFKQFERKRKSSTMNRREKKNETPSKRKISISPLNENFPNSSERTALPLNDDITPPENAGVNEILQGSIDSGEMSNSNPNITKPPRLQVNTPKGAIPKIINEKILNIKFQLSREIAAYRENRDNNTESSEEEISTLDKSQIKNLTSNNTVERTKNVTIRSRPRQNKEQLEINQGYQLDLDNRDTLHLPSEPVKNLHMEQSNLDEGNIERRYKSVNETLQGYLPRDTQINENHSLFHNNQSNYQVKSSEVTNSVNISQRPHMSCPSNTQKINYPIENPLHNTPQNQLSHANHSTLIENNHNLTNNNTGHDNNYPNEMRQTYPTHTGYYPYVPQMNAYSSQLHNNTQNQFINYPSRSVNNMDYSQVPINENNQQPAYIQFAMNHPNASEPINPVHWGDYNHHPQFNFQQNNPHQGNPLPRYQVQNVNTFSANRRSRYQSSYLIPQPPGSVNAIRKVREWRLTFPTPGLDPEEFLFKLERKMIAEGLTSDVGLVILPEVLTGNALTWYACNYTTWHTWFDFVNDFNNVYVKPKSEREILNEIDQASCQENEAPLEFALRLQKLYNKLLTPPGILEQLSTIIDALPWRWTLHLRTRPISTYNELYMTINQLEATVNKRSVNKINKNKSSGFRDSKSRNKLLSMQVAREDDINSQQEDTPRSSEASESESEEKLQQILIKNKNMSKSSSRPTVDKNKSSDKNSTSNKQLTELTEKVEQLTKWFMEEKQKKSEWKTKEKSKLKCYRCLATGHTATTCPATVPAGQNPETTESKNE